MDLKYYKHYYCSDIENVENYDKALAENFVGWCCHHRLQTWTSDGERRPVDITAAELKALDMYYNRPASELIFLTESEHHSLHSKGKQYSEDTKKKLSEALKGKHKSEQHRKNLAAAKKGKPTWNKGKKMSEEYCRKNSESHKGQTPWNKGIPASDETRRKMSEAKKGKSLSEEHKNKLSEAVKGKHWYNNGKIEIKAKECPDDFTSGRLRK